jgi:excisionase family DNA binding protein
VDKLLTVRELAERLRVAPGSVYHWLSQNRLPVVRFSKRRVRFRQSDLSKYVTFFDPFTGRFVYSRPRSEGPGFEVLWFCGF